MSQKPTTPRPPLPDRLLFTGSNVHGRAIPESLVFRAPNAKGNVTMALTFLLDPEQKITIYSAPSKETGEKFPSWAPYVGLRPGDSAKTGDNFKIIWMQTISPNTFDKILKGLKNTGWTGKTFAPLKAAVHAYMEAGCTGPLPENLGSVSSRLQIRVNEIDDRDNSWRTRELEGGVRVFDPQMEVEWVNSIAQYFAFKETANDDQLAALDSMLFGGSKTSTSPAPNAPVDEEEIAF